MLFTTYGFYARQEGDCGDTVAVLYFPKNACPGSGAVVDGQLLRGASNFAGEISFLPWGSPVTSKRRCSAAATRHSRFRSSPAWRSASSRC